MLIGHIAQQLEMQIYSYLNTCELRYLCTAVANNCLAILMVVAILYHKLSQLYTIASTIKNNNKNHCSNYTQASHEMAHFSTQGHGFMSWSYVHIFLRESNQLKEIKFSYIYMRKKSQLISSIVYNQLYSHQHSQLSIPVATDIVIHLLIYI